MQTLLQIVCNIEISLGSLPARERKVFKGLKLIYDQFADSIDKTKVAYVNETSFQQCVKMHYVWIATTKQEVLIRILPTRSIASLAKIGPRDQSVIVVTDRYQVYAYERQHYCLVHLKRDFEKFLQRDGPDKKAGRKSFLWT